MSKLAIGMFDNATAAAAVVKELERQGFRPDEVDLVAIRTDFETGPPLGPLEQSQSESGLGAGTGVAHTSRHAGLIRALTSMGVPDYEAEDYAEGVRRGAALLLVQTENDRADSAVDVMNRRNACRAEERAAEWIASGWQRQFARAGQKPGLPPHAIYSSGGARVFVW